MAATGYLPKEKLDHFLAELSKNARVYVPSREGDTVAFRPFEAGKAVFLDRPANTPPKAVCYPQSETLFTFSFLKNPDEPQKMEIALQPMGDFPDTVIFAGRPCDVRGFKVIDRVFVDTDTADPYYRTRREKTTALTLSCPGPWAGCFCTSVGGGPADSKGSDVMMTELDKGFYLEAVTEKGEKILKNPDVQDGSSYQADAAARQKAATEAVRKPFGGDRPANLSVERHNSEEFWLDVAAKCISCGACTFLCPTCYCFNITDEPAVTKGERIRSWDACMFAHFTLEASGHNPRPKKNMRYRNRVGHKFYWYPQKYDGAIACTGCGRCIRYCPVSVDISEIVAKLQDTGAAKQTENVDQGGSAAK